MIRLSNLKEECKMNFRGLPYLVKLQTVHIFISSFVWTYKKIYKIADIEKFYHQRITTMTLCNLKNLIILVRIVII